MIKKVILAFYRTIVGIFTLLIGILVLVYTLVWDSIRVYILRKPKIEHQSFDHILEEELVNSKKESVSQPTSTPIDKES